MKLPALAIVTAFALGIACGLNAEIARFALVQQLSYRIPGPPLWVTIIFLITLAGVVACSRFGFAGRKAMMWSLWAD